MPNPIWPDTWQALEATYLLEQRCNRPSNIDELWDWNKRMTPIWKVLRLLDEPAE